MYFEQRKLKNRKFILKEFEKNGILFQVKQTFIIQFFKEHIHIRLDIDRPYEVNVMYQPIHDVIGPFFAIGNKYVFELLEERAESSLTINLIERDHLSGELIVRKLKLKNQP